jgi:hypothetical protein
MKRQFLLFILILMIVTCGQAQRKWVGGQGSAWDNPLNWEPAGSPVMTDDILLDNSQQTGDYAVTLPVNAVTISSIAIMPAAATVIKLVLPAANLASPALTLTSTGDALLLNRGAVFQNASGLSSGQSLRIAGKLRINNGGTYIHNTRSAHANDVVARLSTEDGTEEGVFEFDIPAASSTISLSNRVFGKLKLSAITYSGSVAYSGGGSNPVTVRSDLEIGERVSFSIGFSSIFSIKRNLVQAGGAFNISNDNNASTVVIGGDILQTGGVITETGVAQPVIWLNGTGRQQLQFAGGITNQVTLRCDNISGVVLTTPLALPFRLQLRRGILHANSNALLTLLPGCELEADSVSTSFVNGPLRREGLSRSPHVLFPVGNESKMRWLALKNATGNFTVSYKQENPNDMSAVMAEGIDHISSLETWIIDGEGEQAEAMVELSFDNMHSGGVTDLQTLRVAQLQIDGQWKNRGNTATTGSAGAAGSVTSEPVIVFDQRERFFTLASSVSNENILPRNAILFTGRKEGRAVRFDAKNISALSIDELVLQAATDKTNFREVNRNFVSAAANRLSFVYHPQRRENYFRMQVILKGGSSFLSRVVYINADEDSRLYGNVSVKGEQLVLRWHSEKNEELKIHLHDMLGRVLMIKKERVKQGENNIMFQRIPLSKGMYIISVVSGDDRTVMKIMVP